MGELEGVGRFGRVCGNFSQPVPEPADFRLELPHKNFPTPLPSPSPQPSVNPSNTQWDGWLMAIQADPSDDQAPAYSGDGGQPWSRYEMAVVRDVLEREIQRATFWGDELSGPKMVRLAFHDCLGSNGCDGCLDWTDVGTDVCGSQPCGDPTQLDAKNVKDREFQDWQRRGSNNGLETAVEFLEHVYTFDFGAAECWKRRHEVTGGRIGGDTTVKSVRECQQLCLNTSACVKFQVRDLGYLQSSGTCSLHNKNGEIKATTKLRIAGEAPCPKAGTWTLQSRGKSRADLWAFASLLAVEEGMRRNNAACRGDRHPHGTPMCVQREDEAGCAVWPSRPFFFKTGRKDCKVTKDKPYKANETDVFPDDHFNGEMVVRYMEDHFAFSAKETVIIMGAHTLGRLHQHKTGHKYVWASDWQAFNNQYYRNLAARDDWMFNDGQKCTKVGDAWNNRGRAFWVAKMNNVFRSGGPVQWIQKKVVCPNCEARKWENKSAAELERNAGDQDCCEVDVPKGAFCRPDGVGALHSKTQSSAVDRDPDFYRGCEYSQFIPGRDESALNSDMGLMYKFEVDIRGFPSGCPGLGTFYPSAPMRFSDDTCAITDPNDPNFRNDRWTAQGCQAECPKNTYTYPGDSKTLSQHVEDFADDQGVWVEEFIPTMEKMISNGYVQTDLVTSWPLP